MLTILLPVAALLVGCGAIEDRDVVARVGEVTLDQDAFEQLLTDAGIDTQATISLDQARPLISQWIESTAIEEELFTPDAIEAISEEELARAYEDGLAASGIACPALIITETVDGAEAAADRLRSGDPFADVFVDSNIEPALAESLGEVGCFPIDQLGGDVGSTPDGAALLAVNASEPYAVAELPDQAGSSVGFLVVYRSFDVLSDQDRAIALDTVRRSVGIGIVVSALDIEVDPRYGTFDAGTGSVIPLG